MSVEPLRLAFRREVRDRALGHARDVVAARGWSAVTMSDVAAAVGVSRPTIYKEFGDRQGLGQALLLEETERFLAGVQVALDAEPGDSASALVTAVLYVLREAERSPLLHGVLTARDDGLLPLLTTRSQPVLDAARDVVATDLAERFPDSDALAIDDSADALVRLVVSHLVQPAADPVDTASRLARTVLRTLGQPVEAGARLRCRAG